GSTGVTLTDVHIGTTAVAASPLPNTNVDLPGVGHVVLNEQTVTSKGVDVKAIHVFVDSLAGYHGDFVIAHASTFDRGTAAGFLDASAFALRAHIAKVLDTGTLGLVSIGCLGSGEKTVTMAETTVPLVDGTVLAHTQTAAAAASGVVGSRRGARERVLGVRLA